MFSITNSSNYKIGLICVIICRYMPYLFSIFEEYSDLPFYKKTGYWVCGIEEVIKEKPEIPEEVRKQIEDSQISIEETSAWKKVTNINAIILCTAAIFIWGFFA